MNKTNQTSDLQKASKQLNPDQFSQLFEDEAASTKSQTMINQVPLAVNESVMKTVDHTFNPKRFLNNLEYDEKMRSACSTPVFVSEGETALSSKSSKNDATIEFNDAEYESQVQKEIAENGEITFWREAKEQEEKLIEEIKSSISNSSKREMNHITEEMCKHPESIKLYNEILNEEIVASKQHQLVDSQLTASKASTRWNRVVDSLIVHKNRLQRKKEQEAGQSSQDLSQNTQSQTYSQGIIKKVRFQLSNKRKIEDSQEISNLLKLMMHDKPVSQAQSQKMEFVEDSIESAATCLPSLNSQKSVVTNHSFKSYVTDDSNASCLFVTQIVRKLDIAARQRRTFSEYNLDHTGQNIEEPQQNRPKRFRGKPAENSKVLFKDEIANNKLRVLLKTSNNYKLFCEEHDSQTQFFKGMIQANAAGRADQVRNQKDNGGKYCKFDFFSDEAVGLGKISDLNQKFLTESQNSVTEEENLIPAANDEDYETDGDVLKKTKKICVHDVTQLTKSLFGNQHKTERSTHNFKFQSRFGDKNKVDSDPDLTS